MSVLGEALDRVAVLGGHLRLEGEKIKIRLPEDCPEAAILVETIRANREAVIQVLRERESQPPTLEEVQAKLPPGVRVVSYHPKPVPFSVALVSIVTDARRFFRAYIADLAWRLAEPDSHACPPLGDILTKLADGGLELKLEQPPWPVGGKRHGESYRS